MKEVILLAPVFVSLFAGINLFLFPWKGNQSKLLLGLFLVLSGIFFGVIALYQTRNFQVYQYADGVFMSLLLVFHPLFYLYVWSVTKGRKVKFSQMWHFLPAALTLVLSMVFYSFLQESERLYYLSEYMNGLFIDNFWMQGIHTVFKTGKIIHLFQALLYFTLALVLILHHKEHLDEYFSNTANIKLNWLFVYNFLFILPVLAAIAVNFVPTKTLNTDNRYIYVTFSIFTFFYGAIGIIGARQRRIFPESATEEPPVQAISASKSAPGRLKEELLHYFKVEKPYCNPDLEIWDLCTRLKTNRTYVSQLINEEFGINFSTFVNGYRVKEAQRLLEDPANQQFSLDSVALMAGFNSVVSMNRWFKKFTGITPGIFREKARKEASSITDTGQY
ncbi:MAG: helix-turn-helix domain-containing protein [Bacteroidales bacterium]